VYEPIKHRCVPEETYFEGNSGVTEEVAVIMMLASFMAERNPEG